MLSLPLVGECPIRITLAVALVFGVMSAFISNTATPAMMVAIVAGILSAIEEAEGKKFCSPNLQFSTGLCLCAAFAGSIGGLATAIAATLAASLGFMMLAPTAWSFPKL